MHNRKSQDCFFPSASFTGNVPSAENYIPDHEGIHTHESRKEGSVYYDDPPYYGGSYPYLPSSANKYPLPQGLYNSFHNYEDPRQTLPSTSGFPYFTMPKTSSYTLPHPVEYPAERSNIYQHTQMNPSQYHSLVQKPQLDMTPHDHQAIDMRKSIDKSLWLPQTMHGDPQGPSAITVTYPAESLPKSTYTSTSSWSSMPHLSPLTSVATHCPPLTSPNAVYSSTSERMVFGQQAMEERIHDKNVPEVMTNIKQQITDDVLKDTSQQSTENIIHVNSHNLQEMPNFSQQDIEDIRNFNQQCTSDMMNMDQQIREEVQFNQPIAEEVTNFNQQSTREIINFTQYSTESSNFNQQTETLINSNQTQNEVMHNLHIEPNCGNVDYKCPYYEPEQPPAEEVTFLREVQHTTDRQAEQSDYTNKDVQQSYKRRKILNSNIEGKEVQKSSKPARSYESGREPILKPIQTKILRYKDGRKRTFMILHKSSFESMQDKGLVQPVKTCGDGHFHPVTRDEVEYSKTLLPPHKPEDIEKIQYTNIFHPENLQTEIVAPPFHDITSVRRLPLIENYNPKHSFQIPERSQEQYEPEMGPNSLATLNTNECLTSPQSQNPVLVTWSVTSVTESPALTFTIKLPSKLKESTFSTHIQSKDLIFPAISNTQVIQQNVNSLSKTFVPSSHTDTSEINLTTTMRMSQDIHFSSQKDSFHINNPDQASIHCPPDEESENNDKGGLNAPINKPQRYLIPSAQNIWSPTNVANSQGPMMHELSPITETSRCHYKEFETTKMKMKNKYEQLLVKHRRKYKLLSEKFKHLEKTCSVVKDAGSREQILRDAKRYLSNDHALFLESQLYLQNREGKGNRYSKKFLEYLVSLYEKSPAGYRFLRTIFTIPSVRTINKWQNSSSEEHRRNLTEFDSSEMSTVYREIDSFSDLLQIESFQGHEQKGGSHITEFQELAGVPPTEAYEGASSFYWQDAYPGEVCAPDQTLGQEVNNTGCEVEYIQNASDPENLYFNSSMTCNNVISL